MSRDGSGNYTLPAGNPVVTGTVIATTWANPTLSDVGQTLTESLDRNGRGAMLAALRLIDGTAGIPALAFSSETGSGLFRVGAAVLGISVSTTEVARFSAAQFSTVLGSAAVPPIAFTGDLNTGLYSPGADQLSITTGGVQRVAVAAAGNVTVAAPSSGTALTVNGIAAGGVSVVGPAATTFPFLSVTGTTTGAAYSDVTNTSGSLRVGIDSSVGGVLLTGSGAYSGIVGTTSNTAFNIGTNNTVRMSIASAGNVTINEPSSGFVLTLTHPTQTGVIVRGSSSTGVANLRLYNDQNSAVRALELNYAGSAYAGSLLTGAAAGEAGSVATSGAYPFYLGTNSTVRLTIGAVGNVTVAAPSSGNPLTVNNSGASGSIYVPGPAATTRPCLISDGTTTGANYVQLSNTSGSVVLGVESSAGAVFMPGTAGYSAFLYTNNNPFYFGTNSLVRFGIESDGRVYGKALHNNGTVTGTTNQYIASGTYTPTATNIVNLDSTPTALGPFQWIRVGNVVTLSGIFTVDPTTTSTLTSFRFDVPIASAFVNAWELAGVACDRRNGSVGAPGGLEAEPTSDKALVQWQANIVTSGPLHLTATYVVL